MKIGDEVYIHGYIDEIRKDTIIIKNEGGYFGTIPSEVNRQETVTEFADRCRECGARYGRLLQQEPKTDGDAISRDMALEKMADYISSGYADSANDFEEYSKIICELPSVNPPEPKTGHWIHTEECDEEWQYRCSKCNMPSRSNAHRYCSNCGSYMYSTKMESEGEDCISRQAVKELFEEGDVIGIYDFLGIGDLPSVQPKAEQEPKTDILDKIRAIVKEWKDDSWTDGLSYECMIKISELFTESEG